MRMIPARWDAVVPSKLCTLVANAAGASVSTIEHVMAALAGSAISNALIEIDGPEVPILDGSAAPFVEGFLDAGIVEQAAPVVAIRILRAVEVRDGEALARLEPSDMLEIDFKIDFEDAAIGRQAKVLNMSNGAFRARIVRQPHLLPQCRCDRDAGARPGAGRHAGKRRGV